MTGDRNGWEPLVSIITPCFNRAQYLPASLDSLALQDYARIEHIVVDGGSTDGTVDILRRRGDAIRWVSEPDKGQADALNKAMGLVLGEVVGWLNSDDVYLAGAVTTAVSIFAQRPELDVFYGSCYLIDAEGTRIGKHSTKPFNVRRLIWYDGGFFTIQSMFFRRRVWDVVGPFDTSLGYALDYDWMVRAGLKCRVEYIPVVLGAFRRHDDATQGLAHRRAYRREVCAVSDRYGGWWITPIKSTLYFTLSGNRWVRKVLPIVGQATRPLRRAGLLPEWL